MFVAYYVLIDLMLHIYKWQTSEKIMTNILLLHRYLFEYYLWNVVINCTSFIRITCCILLRITACLKLIFDCYLVYKPLCHISLYFALFCHFLCCCDDVHFGLCFGLAKCIVCHEDCGPVWVSPLVDAAGCRWIYLMVYCCIWWDSYGYHNTISLPCLWCPLKICQFCWRLHRLIF